MPENHHDNDILTEAQFAALADLMSENRIQRIDDVLARRTTTVTVLFENIYKHHNLSAVLRTCEGLGIQDIHVASAWPLEVAKGTTQGSDKWLTIHTHPDIETAYAALRKQGYVIAASVLSGDSVGLEALDPTRRLALVFGNEKDGLSETAIEQADVRFFIPMYGFVQSYNISVACAMALYHMTQRRVAALGSNGDLDPEYRAALKSRWYRSSVKMSGDVLSRADEFDTTVEPLKSSG